MISPPPPSPPFAPAALSIHLFHTLLLSTIPLWILRPCSWLRSDLCSASTFGSPYIRPLLLLLLRLLPEAPVHCLSPLDITGARRASPNVLRDVLAPPTPPRTILLRKASGSQSPSMASPHASSSRSQRSSSSSSRRSKSKRPSQLALFCASLAALAGAAEAQITVTVPQAASGLSTLSNVLSPSYAGMGFEPSNLAAFVGAKQTNQLTMQLLSNLANYTGQPPHLRVGGNTGDIAVYHPTYDSPYFDPNPKSTGATDSLIFGPAYFEQIVSIAASLQPWRYCPAFSSLTLVALALRPHRTHSRRTRPSPSAFPWPTMAQTPSISPSRSRRPP